ncbi:MAG: hypothetical protein E3J78_04605, partial [Candidatus Cloacimonadota bacterium]
MAEKVYILEDFSLINFLGENDRNLRIMQSIFSGKIVVRGGKLILIGKSKEIQEFENGLQAIMDEARGGKMIDEASIDAAFESSERTKKKEETLVIKTPKKVIRPRTDGQMRYLEAMEKNDIVICIGPSGTGKTYLAVGKAIQ